MFRGILFVIVLVISSILTEPTKGELTQRRKLLIFPEEEKDAKLIRQAKKY